MLIYANEKNLMTYIFPERGKIDKAQFILDRSELVLKTCKIPTASLKCKMLQFSVYYSRRLLMRTPFIKFSASFAEKIEVCKILWPYNS